MQKEQVADLPHLSNRYDLLEVVKSDGFRITVRAVDLVLKKNVTIRTVHKSVDLTESEIRKFENQARSAAKLSHTQIESVLDYGLCEKVPYLVTEYCEGESLRQFVERNHPINLEEALDLFCELVQIVEYMHDQKVIHNNLSLDAILLNETAKNPKSPHCLKIVGLDFVGFSHVNRGEASADIEAWQNGSVRSDKYKDINALGRIFEQTLLGSAEKKDMPVASAFRSQKGKSMVSRRLGYGIMDKIIKKCLATEKNEQFQSAFSLRKELKEARARLHTWDNTPAFHDKPIDKKSSLDKLNMLKEKASFGDDSTFIFVNAAVLLAISAIVLYYLFARVF